MASGGCLMRVTRVGSDTTLGQMYRLVQEAQSSKANIQRTADRVARVFVPAVILLSVFTFAVWTLLVFHGDVEVPAGLRNPSASGEVDPSVKLLFTMQFGMAVLMIACPCAMGLATPMAVMIASGVAAKRGCLVKSAAALETAARVHSVVLDKTGTITEGAPVVQGAAVVAGAFGPLLERWRVLCKEHRASPVFNPSLVSSVALLDGAGHEANAEAKACFWWLLWTLESISDHPVGRCIVSMLSGVTKAPPPESCTDFESLAGRGLRCVVQQLGGITVKVGNLRYFEESCDGGTKEANAALLSWANSAQQQGQTVVLMHANSVLLGAVSLKDPIRPDAVATVRFFLDTLRVNVWLCTGDNASTAKAVAKEVGIENVVAEALPETKRQCVSSLQGKKLRVAFIGDGVNDSPALAQADVGIAVGVGAQVAVEAADVTLLRSDLSNCAMFLALARSTLRTIYVNFFWAFCFNFVCLPLAAGVFYPTVHIPPLVAGIGMASSSCFVVLWSLRLRNFRPPKIVGSETIPSVAVGSLEMEEVPLID